MHIYKIFVNDEEVYSVTNFDAYEYENASGKFLKFYNILQLFDSNIYLVFLSTTHPSSSIFPAIGRFRNLNFEPAKPNQSVGVSPPIAARVNQHVIAEGFDISPEYELSLDASFYRKGSMSTIVNLTDLSFQNYFL